MQNRTPPLAIFTIFLRLGLTSFGGPIAHLGYFREEFVGRRRWFDEAGYADLVALCQFLPGPASSQVGFAIGLMRGGRVGALAAWTAFTLPSAILMIAFAWSAATLSGTLAQGALHGLKLVAVAVVAQAVWGMARSLAPDWPRATIASAALALTLGAVGSFGQIAAILIGALAGLVLAGRVFDLPPLTKVGEPRSFNGPSGGVWYLIAAIGLLLVLPLAVWFGIGGNALSMFDAFYRAGALVFGGGHVVLPLIEESVVRPGWITHDMFLAGYGAAQAVPGPLFSIAAYLGAASGPFPNGMTGAAIALVAIFLPGLLLVAGTLPYWDRMRHIPSMRRAMAGVNAAVVGILAAALYDPLWTSAIGSAIDVMLVAAGIAALVWLRMPPLLVVVALTAAGVLAVSNPG